MKIRTILPIVSSLSAFALPALAQDAPAADKAPQAEEPSKPAEAPKADAAAAPAPAAKTEATATVDMGGNATTAAPKRTSLAASPVTRGGTESAESSKEWKTDFHGYFRVPFRMGVGSRPAPKLALPIGASQSEKTETSMGSDFDDKAPGQSGTTFHAPIIPDGQYLSWQSTSHNRSDWAELFFGIGNSWAKATVGLQGYNFTDASFNDPNTQYGIGQAFVTLAPDLGYENMRLSLKVGASQDKYGAAGKYDAGEYDTYLFGRTHVIGETLRLDYDLTESLGLWFEQGIGGKRPDPSSFNNARFTMLGHAHVGLDKGKDMQFSAHMLYSWAQEEDRPYDVSKSNTFYANSVVDAPDGNMWVAGADARFDLGAFGYFYGGYSHIGAKNALVVGRALEVLHASGGGEYQLGVVDNYFGPGCVAATTGVVGDPPMPRTSALAGPDGLAAPQGCSAGTGSVDSVLAQYEFSLTNFLQMSEEGGQKFWGEGSDLKIALYGMLNKVTSDYKPVDKTVWGSYDGNLKVKYGADLQYHATPSITAAVRFDRLQPNSDIPEQSFSILSPRIVLTSNWVTREQLTFQYSRYLYNQRECAPNVPSPAAFPRGRMAGSALCVQPPPAATPPDGFGVNSESQPVDKRSAPTTRPDLNVFKIEATFWW
ncbi:MAG TPA: hypothetical protein VHP33_05635 [Polyangiaceae bacterium]|nr:hypothetical protein [Polyangiaceae bacterium]